VLRLSRRVKTEIPQHPIDRFLRSLAEDKHNRAIGVILSGTGSDGTLGLKAIQAEGGITFAQDEKSATYYEMPRNAISSGCVDFELKPFRIGEELGGLGRHPTVGTLEAARDEESLPPLSNESGAIGVFHQISQFLRRSTGMDFSHYEPKAIRRRISRRMTVQRLTGLDAYA